MRKTMRFTLMLVLTLLACTGHRYPTQLVVADSLCTVNPDSALGILKLMEDTMSSAGKADRMYYELLKADAMNKAYVDMTTDSILKEVVDYYDRHGSANERMRAHYLLGCAYRDMGEAPMALQCYQDAVDKADTTDKECDYRLLSRVHSQISDLFHRQNLPRNEISEIWKAYHYAMMEKDTVLALRSYEHMSNAYFLLHMPDSTYFYSLRSAEMYQMIGDTLSSNSALAPAIYICLQRKDFDKAEDLLNTVQKRSNMFNLLDSKANTYYNYRGLLSMGRKDYRSAKYYLYEALRHGHNVNALDFTYKNICSLYRNVGNIDSLVKYTMLYCEINDSTVDRLSIAAVEQMQSLYDYTRSQKLAKEVENENTRIRFRSYLLVGALLMSIITGLSVVYFIRNKKNKTINSNIKEIEQLKEELSKLNTQDHLNNLYETEVVLHLRHLAALGKRAETSDLTRLRATVNLHLPNFMNKLSISGQQMSRNETNLCILVKIGFHPSEIATLLQVTPQAISNLRARLNRKMFKTSDGARGFSKRIIDLS